MRPASEKRKAADPLAGFGLSVYETPAGEAYLGGVEHCYSVWLCPFCSAAVVAHYVEVIGEAVLRWKAEGAELVKQGRGRDVGFATSALRHTRDDMPDDLVVEAKDTWTWLTGKDRNGGVEACRAMARVGLVSWVRFLENMIGERNGHGVGFHGLVFLEYDLADVDHDPETGELAAAEFEGLGETLGRPLVGWLDKRGRLGNDPALVLDVRPALDGRGRANYATKLGMECANGARKSGRSGETYSPMGLAIRAGELAEVRGREFEWIARALRDWARAIKGTPYMATSKGWWERHAPHVTHRSVRDIVDAGRRLKVEGRRRLEAAADELAAVAAGTAPEADVEQQAEVGHDGEAAGDRRVAVIAGRVVRELVEALYRRGGRHRLVLAVHQRRRNGLQALVCGLVEDMGAVEAMRQLAAVLPHAPPVWRDEDGVVIVSRDRPEWATGWGLVEDWTTGQEAA